jgi:hypothetical protein
LAEHVVARTFIRDGTAMRKLRSGESLPMKDPYPTVEPVTVAPHARNV